MTIDLFKTHTLTITRVGDDDNKGYYDSTGAWVQSNTTTTFDVAGSLQPFRNARRQIVLPEGTRDQDVKVFFTKEALRAFQQVSGLPPDTTVINGNKYTIFEEMDWNGFNLEVDHYEYVLLMDNPR